jgi:enamine deaminase RidA (YjgF/YER057c/UK114 family)
VRITLSLVILACLLGASGRSQSNKKLDPDAGYIPTVAPEDKKKKKTEETQALALPPELPTAVVAETGRLTFQVTPLSTKGLLSQQTRESIKALLHSSRGTIVKLRAFVAGSGDLRRVSEITGEMFQDKHVPLPALTVVQVGALPLEGAQVVIEATELDRKIVNPSGVAFLAAQPAPSVAESLAKLKSELQSSEVLLVTCFVSSFDDQRDPQQAMSTAFPNAALDYVQMQRAPVTPPASCEATARVTKAGASSSPQVAVVSSPEIVISGTQLAFGTQDADLKLAMDRLERALAAKGARFDRVVFSHLYLTSANLTSRVLLLQPASAARSVVSVEALPSLDSAFGLDVIAVPGTAPPQNRD